VRAKQRGKEFRCKGDDDDDDDDDGDGDDENDPLEGDQEEPAGEDDETNLRGTTTTMNRIICGERR